MRGMLLRRTAAYGIALSIGAFGLTSPARAQDGGMLKGQVFDSKQQPVEGAKIVIEFTGTAVRFSSMQRRFEVKSNKKGEFQSTNMAAGTYKVTASKDGVGTQTFNEVLVNGAQISHGEPTVLTFVLGSAAPTVVPGAKEAAAKAAAMKTAFDAGVEAVRAGNNDEAIAKFNEVLAGKPNCPDCEYNIGYAYAQKKEYDKAEAAYKKAIALKADHVDAYNGLALVYNAQKKFQDAAAASQKAAELAAGPGAGAGASAGGADALYNQGVIEWNAGKIAEAKTHFEAALKANPNMADAHYQLGMVLLNEGKMPDATAEFETYVKLAPSGQFAVQAKTLIAQLKK